MNKLPIIVLAFLVIVLAVTFSSPTYTGNVVSVIDTKYLLNNLDEVKDDYNSNIENVPGFFKSLFGNEVIRLTIAMEDGSRKVLYMKTQKGKILYINETTVGNYSLDVKTSEGTINSISNSEDQVREIQKALSEEDIIYKAITFKMKVKTKLAGMSYKVWSWVN